MALTLASNLPGLTPREAVADAVYRGILAFDHSDESLLTSALTEDVSTEMPGRFKTTGLADFKTTVFDRVSKLDTTHFLSNMRVSVESETAAKATCSVTAVHVRPGKGFEPWNSFTAGGFYLCDLVKDGELWKIRDWSMKIVWGEGDPSVMNVE